MAREYTHVDHAPRVCDYCGTTYKPKNIRSVRCPSDNCRKAHNKAKMRQYVAEKTEQLGYSYRSTIKRNRTTYNKQCGFCGAGFQTHSRGAKYCTLQCAQGAHKQTPGYYGTGVCETCGATYPKSGPAQLYCTPDCNPKAEYIPKPFVDRRSALRKGYEENDKTMFFEALKADCDINETTNCWEWQRQQSKGYAKARFANKSVLLHRLALEMSEGKPLGVLHAHHKCANTMCVNPEHLEPATAADNSLEMLARNSFIARIEELENALREINPGHEILNRVAAT